MAEENGLNGVAGTQEAGTSKTYEEEEEKNPGINGNLQEAKKSKEDEKTNSVPFHKLFSFADSIDILLMIVGTIGAVGNGISLPLMTIFLGDTINAFGQNQNKDVVHVVSKVNIFSTRFKQEPVLF